MKRWQNPTNKRQEIKFSHKLHIIVKIPGSFVCAILVSDCFCRFFNEVYIINSYVIGKSDLIHSAITFHLLCCLFISFHYEYSFVTYSIFLVRILRVYVKTFMKIQCDANITTVPNLLCRFMWFIFHEIDAHAEAHNFHKIWLPKTGLSQIMRWWAVGK